MVCTQVDDAPPLDFLGLKLRLMPAISLSPRFALTVDELMHRVSSSVSISQRSHLLLDGDITLESLSLDGALSIRAAPGIKVIVRNASIVNHGWSWQPLEPRSKDIDEALSIRGFRLHKTSGVEIELTHPGTYELSGEGNLSRL